MKQIIPAPAGTCRVRSNQGSDQAGVLVSGGSGGAEARQMTERRTPGLLPRFHPLLLLMTLGPHLPPFSQGELPPLWQSGGDETQIRPSKSGARRCCLEA